MLAGRTLRELDEAVEVTAILGERPRTAPFTLLEAATPELLAGYRALRRDVFVGEQGLFETDDADAVDADPRTVVLVALDADGCVLGGVRLHPAEGGADLGWWVGGRLAVRAGARGTLGVGPALVRAACARAEAEGALRFDATVQPANEVLFARLGWLRVRGVTVARRPHVLMRWPVGRVQALVDATKSPLAGLLSGLLGGAGLGGAGFVGDDGAPVPGSDLVAACDAIVPSMVERDPEWAGWCAVLVNVNDLAAMGAEPVGLLDAIGARDASFAARVVAGLTRASRAYGVPVLGGHTQLGVPAALTVTALGRTPRPVPAAGGRVGHAVSLTADLGGSWRAGATGRQWDSTTHRSPDELRAMLTSVGRAAPAAAKDVSMAGLVGTLGMLAEASGCGAELDVAAVPRPAAATVGDWFTCFPGFAMITADTPGAAPLRAGPATTAECGRLVAGTGVSLRWPDGELTRVVDSGVTGLGAA